MKDNIFQYKAVTPGSGFRIIESQELSFTASGIKKGKSDDYLIMNEHDLYYEYYPFQDYPDLFLDFSRIKAGPKFGPVNLVKFINEYGFLGLQKTIKANPDKRKSPLADGESIKTVYKEIRDLRFAIAIWEMISNKDINGLQKVLYWENDSLIYDYQDEKYGESLLITSPIHKPERLKYIDKNNIANAAHFLITDKVNTKLSTHVTTQLLIDSKASELNGLFIVPRNLLGVIWLQFSQSISSKMIISRCANPDCGHWIRESKEYCSNACRQKMYRIRQKIISKPKRGKKS